MYILLLIALAMLVLSWLMLGHYSKLWVRRPIDMWESVISGLAAWVHVLAHLAWYAGIALTAREFFVTHDVTNIWILVFSVLLTGYTFEFYIRSNDTGAGDTGEFLKEALQFRRSAQRRLDILDLMKEKKSRRKRINLADPSVRDRLRLQDDLQKEDVQMKHLSSLQHGTAIEVTDAWKQQNEGRSKHPFLESIEEVRIDPQRKRLQMHIMFSEEQKDYWNDEENVIRMNRQVFEFFRLLTVDPFLKPYTPFIESYFIICRRIRITPRGESVTYPFMKVGMKTEDVKKLEGAYFNPRRLSDVAAVAFDHGDRV